MTSGREANPKHRLSLMSSKQEMTPLLCDTQQAPFGVNVGLIVGTITVGVGVGERVVTPLIVVDVVEVVIVVDVVFDCIGSSIAIDAIIASNKKNNAPQQTQHANMSHGIPRRLRRLVSSGLSMVVYTNDYL